MTEILLVRHGETDWNVELRFQGHADPPLNATGRAQAHALAEELARERIDAVYTSDLARARETAEIVAARLGAQVVTRPDLREVDVGDWEGLTWDDIDSRFPHGRRLWDERGHGWDGGESYEDLGARVIDGLLDIAAAHPRGRVLVVGHGGTIRSVRAHVEARSVAESRRHSAPLRNCEVTRIRVQNGTFSRID